MSNGAKFVLGILKDKFAAEGRIEITVFYADYQRMSKSAFEELKDLGYISWYDSVFVGMAVRVNANAFSQKES